MALILFIVGLLCFLLPIIEVIMKYGPEDGAIERWLADQTPVSMERV